LTDGESARQWRDGRALLIALRGKRGQSCVLAFNPALGLTDAAGRGNTVLFPTMDCKHPIC